MMLTERYVIDIHFVAVVEATFARLMVDGIEHMIHWYLKGRNDLVRVQDEGVRWIDQP